MDARLRLGATRVPHGLDLSDAATAAAIATAAEEEGCESLWIVEHIVVPERYESVYPFDPSGKMGLSIDDDLPDPLIWLTWAAAATRTIRLGTGVMVLPLRNPVVLAKQLATLDRLSGHRIVAGIGTGWLAEEFDAVGVDFSRRGRLMDEHLTLLRQLWAPGGVDYASETRMMRRVHSRPRPAQGGVPLIFGGASSPMIRRAVEYGQGIHLNRTTPSEVARIRAAVSAEAMKTGRDASAFEFTAIAPDRLDDAQALVDAGVTRLIVSVWDGGVDRFRAAIRSYRERVFDRLSVSVQENRE
jgi:probable F420-dependent oxidoreductase